MLPAVFADRLGRLEQVWPSLDDYLAFFTTSTAPLLDPDDPLLRNYLEHDLRDGRVRLSADALLQDAESVYFGDNDWASLRVPVRFLHAEWSVGSGSAPAYSAEAVDTYRVKTVVEQLVPGVDHAGSIMTQAGGRATAEMVRAAVALV